MSMCNVMVDTETFGITPNSALLSIGAVKFNPATDEIGERFNVTIALQSCVLAGMTIDAETVSWWQKQSPDAQASLVNGGNISLQSALKDFSDFMRNSGAQEVVEPVLWCKGGSFDFPILAAAYKAIKQPLPWKFWNERDCRTLFKLCAELHSYELPKVAGTAHSALDDALHQAEQVMRCLRLISPKQEAVN